MNILSSSFFVASDKDTWTGEDEDFELSFFVASDKETWTGEDEDLEPGVRKKKKKKTRVPGWCCHLALCMTTKENKKCP